MEKIEENWMITDKVKVEAAISDFLKSEFPKETSDMTKNRSSYINPKKQPCGDFRYYAPGSGSFDLDGFKYYAVVRVEIENNNVRFKALSNCAANGIKWWKDVNFKGGSDEFINLFKANFPKFWKEVMHERDIEASAFREYLERTGDYHG